MKSPRFFSSSLLECFLKEDEQKALAVFEETICNGPESEKTSVALILESYSPEIVFRLSQTSPLVKSFCIERAPYQKEWIENLQQQNWPGVLIPGQDGAQNCGVYDQYLGAYLFKEYNELALTDEKLANGFLDQACRHHFLFALTRRCELNLLKIQNPALNDARRALVLKEIGKDVNVLSNVYWSLGAAFGCRVYMQLGNYFNSLDQGQFAAAARVFYEKGTSLFCTAELLATCETSQQISDFLVRMQTFLSMFFQSPSKAGTMRK
ncbi:MAG TPA: DUF5630 domain-containing protein [Gammaproteobacteria bacterium]|nr:DUF5630 domain-containing protein [Gammaproteobacteria bacterium]